MNVGLLIGPLSVKSKDPGSAQPILLGKKLGLFAARLGSGIFRLGFLRLRLRLTGLQSLSLASVKSRLVLLSGTADSPG